MYTLKCLYVNTMKNGTTSIHNEICIEPTLKMCRFSTCPQTFSWAGLEVIKLSSISTQLSMKFIMLINVKIPTIVGILTFISMMNTTSGSLKARQVFILQHFSFY